MFLWTSTKNATGEHVNFDDSEVLSLYVGCWGISDDSKFLSSEAQPFSERVQIKPLPLYWGPCWRFLSCWVWWRQVSEWDLKLSVFFFLVYMIAVTFTFVKWPSTAECRKWLVLYELWVRWIPTFHFCICSLLLCTRLRNTRMHFRDVVESGGSSPESLSSLLFIFQPLAGGTMLVIRVEWSGIFRIRKKQWWRIWLSALRLHLERKRQFVLKSKPL